MQIEVNYVFVFAFPYNVILSKHEGKLSSINNIFFPFFALNYNK